MSLSAKFGVPINPISNEPSLNEIAPNAGALSASEDYYLDRVFDDTGNDMLKQEISKYKAGKYINSQKDVVKKDFQQRFDAFLLGRMDPDGAPSDRSPFTKTPGWGNRYTSLMNNAEVRQYVNEKNDARAKFDRYIYVMKKLNTAVGYDPDTGAYWAPGIEEWYLYFKYILEEPGSDNDFLSDWRMYTEKRTGALGMYQRYANKIEGEGKVHKWRNDGEYIVPNVYPVGDANPGRFDDNPNSRNGAWMTNKDAAMINRAAERGADGFEDPASHVPPPQGTAGNMNVDSKKANDYNEASKRATDLVSKVIDGTATQLEVDEVNRLATKDDGIKQIMQNVAYLRQIGNALPSNPFKGKDLTDIDADIDEFQKQKAALYEMLKGMPDLTTGKVDKIKSAVKAREEELEEARNGFLNTKYAERVQEAHAQIMTKVNALQQEADALGAQLKDAITRSQRAQTDLNRALNQKKPLSPAGLDLLRKAHKAGLDEVTNIQTRQADVTRRADEARNEGLEKQNELNAILQQKNVNTGGLAIPPNKRRNFFARLYRRMRS